MAASLHLFHDATPPSVQSPFLWHVLKMSSFCLDLLEDQELRKRPMSAFHTLKSPWPPPFFVLWLGVSSFDQTSPLGILYLCFVDHFYWEQIISFSWKFVMGLRFFFPKLPLTHQMCAIRCAHTHMQISSLFRNAVRFINIKAGVHSQTNSQTRRAQFTMWTPHCEK